MVVIDLHALGLWDAFINAYDVALAESIARDESQFFSHDAYHRASIDLSSAIDDGRISEHSASAIEVADIQSRFATGFAENLHIGERETLALMMFSGDCSEHHFCSSDQTAIQAAAMLGLSEKCVSLEELLKGVGLGRPLSHQYSKRFMDDCLAQGSMKRIMGNGLAPQP